MPTYLVNSHWSSNSWTSRRKNSNQNWLRWTQQWSIWNCPLKFNSQFGMSYSGPPHHWTTRTRWIPSSIRYQRAWSNEWSSSYIGSISIRIRCSATSRIRSSSFRLYWRRLNFISTNQNKTSSNFSIQRTRTYLSRVPATAQCTRTWTVVSVA